MNIYSLLEQKFKSGNNVEVSSVRVSRAEWEAARTSTVLGDWSDVVRNFVSQWNKVEEFDLDELEDMVEPLRKLLASAPKPELQAAALAVKDQK